jgi:predicted signal transduction protein with EAL and GGDEF domain
VNETSQLFVAATGAGTAILGTLALAFVLALMFVVVYVLARRSGEGRAGVERDAVADDLRARIDTLAEELKLARETSARPSGVTAVDEIATSIDLDEVLARTIDAAAALSGADAAMISVEVGKEPPVVAALGISVDAAERQRLAQPPDAEAEAVADSYRDPANVEESRIWASLAVPLAAAGGKSLGRLVVYSMASRPALDDVADPLRAIARRATPAVENALRYREARRLADLDALTGLHNRRYFHETLEREVARSRR